MSVNIRPLLWLRIMALLLFIGLAALILAIVLPFLYGWREGWEHLEDLIRDMWRDLILAALA